MSLRLTRLAVALFATTACLAGAQAQSSYPCANDLPNPYRLVTNWATTPRGWAPINAITPEMAARHRHLRGSERQHLRRLRRSAQCGEVGEELTPF